MPQAPWPCPVDGLILVLDLWSGMGGLLVGLLSLGVRCVCLSVEMDPHLREAQAAAFSGVVHLDMVEKVKGSMLNLVLAKRNFSAILVGGGAPCQANSSLNKNRKGWQDPRSRQPQQLERLAKEVREITAVPVFTFLENVASAPSKVIREYSSIVGGPPLMVDARLWGWAHRNRALWMAGPDDHLNSIKPNLPQGFSIHREGLKGEATP